MVDDPLLTDLAAAAQLRNIARLRAGLEHELRSPLNAIVLNLELLRELIRSGGGATAVAQLDRVEVIVNAVERLKDGFGDLLRETELPKDTIEVFDLGELLEDLRRVVDAELRQQGKGLDVRLGESFAVRGRRDALRQALLHLLINAMVETPEGERVELAAVRAGGRIRIEVRDRGDGFAEDAERRLFERHFSTRSGAGLGLHVARQLIERDGGEIELAETGPSGTALHIYLPEADR